MLPAARASGQQTVASRDFAEARELLIKGYRLAEASRCGEAVPLLERSFELYPAPKAALNLARCEEDLGHFTIALRHWGRARELAAEQRLEEVAHEASTRLGELEARMPHLRIQLDAPISAEAVELRCDGAILPAGTWREALPLDPGPHAIDVTAAGYEAAHYKVTLGVSAETSMVVQLGPATTPHASDDSADPARRSFPSPASGARPGAPAVTAPVSASGEVPSPSTGPSPAAPPSRRWTRPALFAGLGVGIAGLAVGAVTGVATLATASDAKSGCSGSFCKPGSYARVESARNLGNVSTAAFAVGGAGVAVALVAGIISMTSRVPPRDSASRLAGRPSPPRRDRPGNAPVIGPWLGAGAPNAASPSTAIGVSVAGRF